MNPNVTVIQPTVIAERDRKVRVAAYCRVSSDSADQLNSFMAQMRYYENFLADSKTETLVGVYADEGITGTRMDKRDDFQRLLRDCRKGKIDRVITKSISRFARNTKECLSVIRELKMLGITVVFEKENIDTDNISDEMMITIMGGLAQEESNSISQNMRWSVQKRMQNGTYKISRPPYGFDVENGILSVNEKQAQIVRKIFSWYISGCGLQKIADILNENNIPSSKRHKLWTAHSVKYILTNERYIGDAVFQKNYVTETIPHLEKRNYGEKSKYYVSDSNPAIVEKTIFETVQKMLEDRHKPYLNSGHFLSSRIYCNNCGSTFKYKKNTCGDRWVCRKHDVSAEKCLSKPVSQEQIYDAFITLYNKLKLNYSVIFPPMLLQLQELKKRKFSGNQRYMDMSKEIAELKGQTHVLARLRTKGFLDESKYLEQTSAINAKINRLGCEQRKITQSDYEDDIIDKIKEVASIIENGIELMTTFDEILYESLIEKIVVIDQNKLEFQLYGGLKFFGIIN